MGALLACLVLVLVKPLVACLCAFNVIKDNIIKHMVVDSRELVFFKHAALFNDSAIDADARTCRVL